MKVLLDHNISEHLRPLLTECDAFTAIEMGWNELRNGDLLRAAEAQSFVAMVTGDTGIYYQQNNKTRIIALIVLRPPQWRHLACNVLVIQAAIARATPGSYEVVPLTLGQAAVE